MARKPRLDLKGRRFGNLLVLKRTIDPKGKNGRWQCICDCGKLTTVVSYSLTSGSTKSCGCLKVESKTKHGYRKNDDTHYLYSTWINMRQRCLNPNNPRFSDYGGRGIYIDPRWDDFEQFLLDVGERPEGTSLDRIDVNDGYSPDNCRWATPSEQVANRRVRVVSPEEEAILQVFSTSLVFDVR